MLKPRGRAGPIASTGGSLGPGLQPEEHCDVCASAFHVCSFLLLLLCSVQPLTVQNLDRRLASAEYHFAVHEQWPSLSKVSPRFFVLPGAQKKRPPCWLGAKDLTGEDATYSLKIPLCRPSTCPYRGSSPPPPRGGARVVDDTNIVCWLYVLYIPSPDSVQCHGGVLSVLAFLQGRGRAMRQRKLGKGGGGVLNNPSELHRNLSKVSQRALGFALLTAAPGGNTLSGWPTASFLAGYSSGFSQTDSIGIKPLHLAPTSTGTPPFRVHTRTATPTTSADPSPPLAPSSGR